ANIPQYSLQARGRKMVCHICEQLMSVTGINRELLITDLLLRIEHYLQPGVVLPVPHL
ncbi:DNA polymerase III subunit delta' C-terminal domain-containing protein, partial [Escherichia coli]